MSLDIALSTEINKIIDAEQAYDYFLAGIITDKRAFVCPSPNCNAQITCCNIDKEFHDMRQHQHFRVYGFHSYECEINNKTLLIPSYKSKNGKRQRSGVSENYIDEFITDRPRDYYDSKTQFFNTQRKYHLLKYKPPLVKAGTSPSFSTSKVYSVRSIINRYKRYKEKNMLDCKKIRIGDVLMPYSSLLLRINEQSFNKILCHPRCYFGLAYIKPNSETEEPGCVIEFIHKFRDKNKSYQTIGVLYISAINDHNIKYNNTVANALLRGLNEFSLNQDIAYVCVFGVPTKETLSSFQRIKFTITNPDMLFLCDSSLYGLIP